MSTDFNRLLERSAEQQAAIDRWDAAVIDSVLMQRLTRGALLGAKKHTGVFAAQLKGQQVVVRHIVRANAADVVAKTQHDLEQVGPRMCSGDCQVNQVIAADVTQGVLVVSHVPGAPYSEATDPDLLRHAGRWHAAYVGARRDIGHFSPLHWQKKLPGMPRNGLQGDDLALAKALREALRHQAASVQGVQVCRVAGHGDFAPHNFRVDDGVLYGFDTGTAAKVPLARELAHFLHHVALKSDAISGAWGIDAAQVAAFAQAAELPDDEIDTVLRYFYGWYLYRAFLRYARNAGRREKLRVLIQGYLDLFV